MSFASDVAQLAVDDTYAEFGTAAVYTPASGPAVACTILPDLRDPSARPDDGRPTIGQADIEVRKSEVIAPAVGDSFTFNGRTVTVANRPIISDEEGLVWKMWVR